MLEIRKITTDTIKFTFTANEDIRVKVPTTMNEKDCAYWIDIATKIKDKIYPIQKTFRGKIKTDFSFLILQNDSKTESIHIDFRTLGI
jgi:hypothetical protein